MNVAGVLVHCRPGMDERVSAALNALPGVEVHLKQEDGRMVVTVEDQDEQGAGESLLAMHRLEGVISAALVYHHFEPDDAGEPSKPNANEPRES